MRTRIKEIRKSRDITQEQMAERLGIHFTTYNRMEKGRTAITTDRIDEIAKILDCDPLELLAETVPPATIWVNGAVQAGAWAEVVEWPRDDWYPISIPVEKKWRPFEKFASEVRGESMNKIYPPGSILIWVNLIESGLELLENFRYIVERVDAAGNHEITVKEARRDPDGRPWLWPMSTDPNFQEPLPINGPEGTEIRVIGRVIKSVLPE